MKNYLLARVSAAFAAASIVSAVPVPVSGPVAGSGDGLNVRMVQYNSSLVHSIAAAETALALSPGDAEHASEVNDIVNHIDIADGNYGGEITPTHDSVPFGTPDRFAIRFSV